MYIILNDIIHINNKKYFLIIIKYFFFIYSLCFSAIASLSASGSFAKITVAPVAFALAIDKSYI